MKEFTAWEYLCIDVANNHHSGLDKVTFEERIDWVQNNLNTLEEETKDHIWKERPLYIKAVSALRKAQRGEPTGHLVGFDAVCSGMQIMSVLSGCYNGSKATGLVDQNRRADAYTDCTNIMSNILGNNVSGERKKVKQSVMTSLYGSVAEPKKVFGEDTPELQAFYESMWELCPGACTLLEWFKQSWNPGALAHEWKLPDGFDAKIKVMEQVESRIEVDELGGTSFTYVYYDNVGKEKDVKNAANVVHSIDAYVLRALVRRCNYEALVFEEAWNALTAELVERTLNNKPISIAPLSEKAQYYFNQYERSTVIDPVIVPHLTYEDLESLPTAYLRGLLGIINSMLQHPPFDVVTIHDDFKCHPNYMTALRTHYKNILAGIADSDLISDILSQLYHRPVQFQKLNSNLSQYINQSNYALC